MRPTEKEKVYLIVSGRIQKILVPRYVAKSQEMLHFYSRKILKIIFFHFSKSVSYSILYLPSQSILIKDIFAVCVSVFLR